MPESTLTLLSSPGAKTKSPLAFCVDIGAPKSLIERKELNRVLAAAGKHPRHIRASTNRFCFGDSVFTSLGKIQLSDETPPGVPPIDVDLDIVKADVPALLELDVLDREQLVADTVNNSLAHRTKRSMEDGTDYFIDIWSTPMTRAPSGHVYVRMDFGLQTNFTREQLLKLRRQFYHPSSQKLFKLIRKARPDQVIPETLETLEDLSKRCDSCQRIKPAPTLFLVAFGAEDVRFNERVEMDVLYICTRRLFQHAC